MRKSLLGIFAVICCIITGCNSYQGDFVQKSEEELAAMEQQNATAHEQFVRGNYSEAESLIRNLCQERTVSRPLYQLELISTLLMQNKTAEAHELMIKLQEDLEVLFDKEAAEKAMSVWHGEVNKVYHGDSYERATLYALLAMSFIQNGEYDDAIRAVKNGLLADADSNSEEAVEDYALLSYLGYLANIKAGRQDDAAEYLRSMIAAIAKCGFNLNDENGNRISGTCFDHLTQVDPNVLLVVWTGDGPEVVCTGEYEEVRSIVRGKNFFDRLGLQISDSNMLFAANNLADIDYQATTRGGRLMDTVLADKAMAKKGMEISRNILLIAGTGLMVAGATCGLNNVVGLSLFCSGGGCFILGGTAWLIGSMMNPHADGRFWHNLPGKFYIIPLKLAPGTYNLMTTGYYNFDVMGMAVGTITVADNANLQVIHLPMMAQGRNARQAMETCRDVLTDRFIKKADENTMLKELK